MAENLLLNGGAEIDNDTGYSGTFGATVTRVTDEVYEGVRAFRVETAAQAQSGIQLYSDFDLNDTPGSHAYRGGVWVKGLGSVLYWLRVTYSEGGANTNTQTGTYALTETWTELAPPEVVSDPERTASRVWVMVRVSNAAAITFHADSAYVYEVAPDTNRTQHPILKIGTNQRIGPMRVGERN